MYRICEVSIASDLPLPELPRAPARAPFCHVRMFQAGDLPAARTLWSRSLRVADGSVFLKTMRRADGHLLRYPTLADFHITRDDAIRIYPAPRVPRHTLRHLLIDAVMPLYLSRRGELVLHASAVRVPGGAALFLADSGRGKSTLTAALCAAGHHLLADDYLVVDDRGETPLAVPSYPGLRLWPDMARAVAPRGWRRSAVAHYTRKIRFLAPMDARGGRRLPIVRVYVLRNDGRARGVRIEPLAGRRALMALVRQLFFVDVSDRQQIAEQFARLARIAGQVSVRQLIFPRTLDVLPALRNAVARDVAGRVVE